MGPFILDEAESRACTLDFIDTNVLVYVRDRTDANKQGLAAEWMAALWETRRGRLSWQVLQEYYLNMTTKLSQPRDPEAVREDIVSLGSWHPVGPDGEVLELAWKVQDRFGMSWWDALIVAAAIPSGCRWLLTEDLQDGQNIMGLTVVSPFEHAPGDLLGT